MVLTCFGEGMGDKFTNELILRGPQQEDDVRRQRVSIFGEESCGVVDHLRVSIMDVKVQRSGGPLKQIMCIYFVSCSNLDHKIVFTLDDDVNFPWG